jgi:hypothetical protein
MTTIRFPNSHCLMKFSSVFLSFMIVIAATALAADCVVPRNMPKHDGKPADMSKPVKVFIMLGQSNMLGLGGIEKGGACPLVVAVKEQKLYPFLLNDSGEWVERQDVRNVFLMTANDVTQTNHNEWLKVGAGIGKSAGKMGVEFSVGHLLGNACEEPVMLLKSCIGNRSLGHDLLPPGAPGFDHVVPVKEGKQTKDVTFTYAGYHERPVRWTRGGKPASPATTPETPVKYDSGYGDYPRPGKPAPPLTRNPWQAGIQYDWDIGAAKKALAELEKHYPGAKSHEVAGFFFWQGEKDCGDPGLAAKYEANLVRFIHSVRKDFNAPNAKFVIGTLGEHNKDAATGTPADVLNAHLAVDGTTGKYPEFKDNVATVYTHPMARGGSGNGHYGMDSRVYMDVGLAMGDAMLKLLNNNAN